MQQIIGSTTIVFMLLVYEARVRPCLQYCAQLWAPVVRKNKLMEQLQRIPAGGSGSWTWERQLEEWAYSALQDGH